MAAVSRIPNRTPCLAPAWTVDLQRLASSKKSSIILQTDGRLTYLRQRSLNLLKHPLVRSFQMAVVAVKPTVEDVLE